MQGEAKSGIHPLVATASVAVIVLAGVGVAAFTGVLPGTSGSTEPEAAPAGSKTTESRPAAIAESKPVRPKTASRPAPVQVAAAPQAAPAPKCLECGIVESVQEVEAKGEATGAGAVAGGVAGAVIGNQVGSGKKKQVARLLGAAGGAIVGHQIEKNVRTVKRYDIAVRMEDGSQRVLTQDQAPTWRAGDRVRVVNDALEAR